MNYLVLNLDDELKNNRILNHLNPNIVGQMMLNGNNTFYPNYSNQYQENFFNIEQNINNNNNWAGNVSRRAFEQNNVYPGIYSFANEAIKFNNNPNPLVNLNSTRSNFIYLIYFNCMRNNSFSFFSDLLIE